MIVYGNSLNEFEILFSELNFQNSKYTIESKHQIQIYNYLKNEWVLFEELKQDNLKDLKIKIKLDDIPFFTSVKINKVQNNNIIDFKEITLVSGKGLDNITKLYEFYSPKVVKKEIITTDTKIKFDIKQITTDFYINAFLISIICIIIYMNYYKMLDKIFSADGV